MIRLGSGIPSAFPGFANIRSKVASTSRFVTEQVKRSFIGLLYVVGTERIWSVLLVGDSSYFYLAKAADKPPDGNQEKVQDRGSHNSGKPSAEEIFQKNRRESSPNLERASRP